MQNARPRLDRRSDFRSWRLATKLLIAAAAVMIALTVVIDLLVVRQVGSALEVQTKIDVTGSTNSLKYLIDQRGIPTINSQGVLEFGAFSSNDLALVDAVKRNSAAEAAVFQLVDGNLVQRATTFKADNSSRMTESVLVGPAADAIKRGESYTGVVNFQGRDYITHYVVINDIAGKPLGAAFSGKPTTLIAQQTNRITNVITFVSLLLLCFSLAVVFALISRVVTRPLAELESAAGRIGTGDLDVRAPVNSDDELGRVARAVNVMVDQITSNTRLHSEQNDVLQRQIVKLLDEVSSVAEGDLTVQAEVTADALGAVADSFNYMITELRGIVGRVNSATQQVGSSTDEILATTDTLSRAAEQQASRIADTSTAVEEMAVSIQQVSENAAISAQVAREARATVGVGSQAVTATITGMERIRDQVQDTASKIEQLGASSQEIGAIVSLIQEVADQTELLALNAAIEAAMAGEHGRGFAVVAEEVRSLAERTSTASQQIAMLVKGIQSDTAEAIAAMATGSNEVNTGTKLAAEAGQALTRIDSTAVQLSELIEAISLAAEQQARASAGIARAMGEISSVTTSTTAGTQQAASSVAALAALADDLHDSIAAFRLGEEVARHDESWRDAMPAPAAPVDYSRSRGVAMPSREAASPGGLAPASATATAVLDGPSLYDRLGGSANIDVVVEDFYRRVIADDLIRPVFAGIDLGTLKRHQKAFLNHALGGPTEYRGRQMASAHQGLGITTEQFIAVAEHLGASLSSFNVPRPLIDEVIAKVATLQSHIVGK